MKFLLWLAVLLACVRPAGAEGWEQARSSIVHLYALGCSESGEPAMRWMGSGFAVGSVGEESDIFLTNRHVVTGNGQFPAEQVRLWILPDETPVEGLEEPPDNAIECRVLLTPDEEWPDVAVIQSSRQLPGCTALPLISAKGVRPRSAVYALGFPGLADSKYGRLSGPEDVQITEGTLSQRLLLQQAGDTRALVHTASFSHGCSGGPLLNSQGQVIGLNTYGFSGEETLFCSIYIDYGMALLDQLGISYTAAPAQVDGVTAPPYRWLAAGVILLCTLGYVFRPGKRTGHED